MNIIYTTSAQHKTNREPVVAAVYSHSSEVGEHGAYPLRNLHSVSSTISSTQCVTCCVPDTRAHVCIALAPSFLCLILLLHSAPASPCVRLLVLHQKQHLATPSTLPHGDNVARKQLHDALNASCSKCHVTHRRVSDLVKPPPQLRLLHAERLSSGGDWHTAAVLLSMVMTIAAARPGRTS